MKNMDLNAGGVVGGLLGAGAAGVFLYWKGDLQGRVGKFFAACVVGGAVAGNFVWGLVFPAKDVQPQAADGASQ